MAEAGWVDVGDAAELARAPVQALALGRTRIRPSIIPIP